MPVAAAAKKQVTKQDSRSSNAPEKAQNAAAAEPSKSCDDPVAAPIVAIIESIDKKIRNLQKRKVNWICRLRNRRINEISSADPGGVAIVPGVE